MTPYNPWSQVRVRGEDHPHARLKESEARAILTSDEPPSVLANRYHISLRHIRSIKTGRRWSHVYRYIHGHAPPSRP